MLGGLLPEVLPANELLVQPESANAAALKPVIFIKSRRSNDFSGILITFRIILYGFFV
jgi:hypothetical protein